MLNGSSIRSENLWAKLESFKDSNALNYNADSSAILELCLVEFEKRLFFNSQMISSYVFVQKIC